MTAFAMQNILALQFESDTAVTLTTGTYNAISGQSVTFCDSIIDLPPGTVVAIMRNATAPGGEMLQCFRVDEVVTV